MASTVLVAIAGFLASMSLLQLSGLSLLGALSATVAAATRVPRLVTSWIPSAVIMAAIVTVILAGQLALGTPHRAS